MSGCGFGEEALCSGFVRYYIIGGFIGCDWFQLFDEVINARCGEKRGVAKRPFVLEKGDCEHQEQ